MKSNAAVRRSSLGRSLATTTLLLAAVSSSYCRRLLITSSSAVVVVSLQQSSATTCASASRKRSIRHHRISPITITSTSTSLLHSNNNAYSSEEEGRRGRKKRLEKLQKQRRRNRWMKRYGTVEALKQTFGTGPPWGDLSPTQTRLLYHTLLPRSLLALNEMGFVTAEDLAPLAYEARIAAKEYARSRCVWTGRVGVFLFDQYRSLRDKGRLIQPGKSSSMSWEEIWAKYEGQILKEHAEKKKGGMKVKELDEDELMMQTYMRILERSCSTNQTFDKLFLPDKEGGNGGGGGNGDISLASIASQLDHDVRTILLSPSEISKVEKKVKKMEKKQLKEREKEEKKQRKADRKKEKRKEREM